MSCTCDVCTAPTARTSWRDRLISHRLDALIIELDGSPPPMRARWLRVLKAGIERAAVPRIAVVS